jgi:hypothetical protein
MNQAAERLAEEVRQGWPGLRVELDAFPSGAFMLDAYPGTRHFQLAYFPSQKLFGVDEIREDDSFTYFYRFTSPDFAPAAAEFRRLVEATRSVANGVIGDSVESKSIAS